MYYIYKQGRSRGVQKEKRGEVKKVTDLHHLEA
jgi:hypothetical protein